MAGGDPDGGKGERGRPPNLEMPSKTYQVRHKFVLVLTSNSIRVYKPYRNLVSTGYKYLHEVE
jgi:hypothetical protein